MKSLALVAAIFLSMAAKADIITCTFTEPFATITYTTGTQVMTIDAPATPTQTLNHIGFLIIGANQFELTDSTGKDVMDLTLNGKGTDGMSNTVYPFTAKYGAMIGNANSGIGGCSSLKLKESQDN